MKLNSIDPRDIFSRHTSTPEARRVFYLQLYNQLDNMAPCAVDDLGLSLKAVDTIERLGMWDTPNYQITFRKASGRAVDVLNCLLESSDFDEVMGYLLLCLDSFLVNTQAHGLDGDDYEAEEEMRNAGHIVLHGADAGRFYATEAANALKQLMCKELPILASSFPISK